MPNAKDLSVPAYQRILVLGRTGAGKTTQFLTLPGRKFLYVFDPGALPSLRGHDIEYEPFLPDANELDATLKGFNKNAKPDDKLSGKNSNREPTVYKRWVEDLNAKAESGFFNGFDWLGFDSLTLLITAIMDRQLWINNRYGSIEELGDFRVVGSKMAEVFRSIFSLPINIYCTGHMNTYQDDKTKKLETQINLPGRARQMLPLLCTNIWELRRADGDKLGYSLVTKPEPRGFLDIRTSIQDLKTIEDVTVKDFRNPQLSGIGAVLTKAKILTLRDSPTSSASNAAAVASK